MFLVAIIIGGLIIGALGRLVVPGPNPMGLVATCLVGIGGSVVGGIIGRALSWRHRYSIGFGFILSVLCTAGIVYLIHNRTARRRI